MAEQDTKGVTKEQGEREGEAVEEEIRESGDSTGARVTGSARAGSSVRGERVEERVLGDKSKLPRAEVRRTAAGGEVGEDPVNSAEDLPAESWSASLRDRPPTNNR